MLDEARCARLARAPAAGAAFVWWYDRAGQKPDAEFDARVRSPAFAGIQHPRVLIDEAHRNFHTASGRYKPFAELLRADGYAVSANRSSFTQPPDAEVLVIANALGPGEHETQPAFTVSEEDALVEWVRRGGALFLVADHSPFGSAAERLAQRFGVTMHLRYARDDKFHDDWDNERLDFSRANGLADAIPILRLSDGAYDWESRKIRFPARGHLQALALKSGRGRVVVSGEAALFSAQVDALGLKYGMNREGNDDRQLLLNIAHWLASP